MTFRLIRTFLVYGAILALGLAVGWAAPRLYQALKPAYTAGDYTAFYKDRATNVVVFGTPTCPYCEKTRAYLRAHQIQFVDLDITSDPKAKSDFAQLGTRSVPVILVGGRRVDGFLPAAVGDALKASGYRLVD